jgi:hypothetical protein
MMGKMGMEDITTTAPGINNLNILTSGLIPPNSAELLNSSKMSEILSEVEGSYDIVLLDCSPVLPTTDAVITSAKADGVVMVYQVGQVARGALKRSKTQLENSKANVIGVVLNGLKPETGKDYKDYGYYGYDYGYGAEGEETREQWYKRWFKTPIITGKLQKIIIGDKEEEKEVPGISKPKYKNLIKKWFKVPDVVNNLSEKINGSTRKEQPELDSVRKLQASQERTNSLKERPWKKWLKIIILIITSTVIFYGLLWQFGILKY